MLSHLTKVNDTYVPPGSWWNIVPRGKAGQRRSNRVFLARREEELSKRAIVSFLFSLARVGEPHTYIYSYPRFEAEDGDGRVGRIRRIWPRPLIERGYRYQPLSAYPLGRLSRATYCVPSFSLSLRLQLSLSFCRECVREHECVQIPKIRKRRLFLLLSSRAEIMESVKIRGFLNPGEIKAGFRARSSIEK